VDSWLQNSAQGSGTAVGISGLQRELMQQGHTVTRMAPDITRPRNLLLRRLWFNVRLPELLRRQPFDLVVGFDIDGFLYSPRRRTVPFVCSVKGVAAEEARQETGTARWLLGGLARLEGANSRSADLVLTTSNYCRDAIRHHYGVPAARIRLVHEGIDLARWQRLRAEVPHHSDGVTILCVARQYRRKRVKDLLHALPLVRRHVPGAHGVIVGAGPEHPRLRRLVRELALQDAVQLRGEIPDDDEVALLYRRADLFCLPTIQEGFGIVFLEAMAAGLPVVSTTAAAIPEVVPHGAAGWLVPPRDVGTLAEALVGLLRDPARRAAYGAFGQVHAQRFDWPVVAASFLAQVAPLVRTA
jgi:glycosyltransferase involved in cell wall biosynthesis